MERYYQKEIECASQEQIKAWQDERLVRQVRHVWDKVPYYRAKMEEKGVTPEDIHGRDDLYKLPFLSKADLRDAYPYRSACGAAGKMRPHPLHLRHDRQARRRLLHPARYRPLGRLLRTSASWPRAQDQGRRRARSPTATACSPAASGLNGGCQKLGCADAPHVLRQYRPAAAVHGATSARRSSAARRPTRRIWQNPSTSAGCRTRSS